MRLLGPAPGNAWRVSAELADLVRTPAAPRPVAVAARPKRVALDLARTVMLVVDCAATTNPDYCRDATLLNIRQIFGFTGGAGDSTGWASRAV